jgi:hypothetical protein
MTTSPLNAPQVVHFHQRSRKKLVLPREHGFWTMLAAAQLVSLSKVGLSAASVATLTGSVALVTLGGALAGPRIRRDGNLQVLSSAALGVSGLPIELSAGVPLQSALATGLTWTVVFVASALTVRAAFARKKSRRNVAPSSAPRRLEATAFIACVLAAIGCAAWSQSAEALALAFTALCVVAFGSMRFSPKQVKELGLLLAGMMLLVATTLIFGSTLLRNAVLV